MFYSKPWLDALIVLAVILLFFGPKRLPALGRSLGHGMREFKDAITGHSQPTESERAELEAQTAPAAAAEPSPPATASAPDTEPATVSSTSAQGSSGSKPG
jgi:sec-independent protein translocase protein TatA